MSKATDIVEGEEDHMLCLFDLVEKKVGCVLLQAAFGGSNYIPNNVDTHHWFLAPTPNMKLYKIPMSQVPQIIEQMRKNGNSNS